MIEKKNILVICGATASGKTRLGVDLALRYNGEVISADSRQVYSGMDIGTGKDLQEYRTEKGSVPFHLIDIADPRDIYTLYDYKSDFEQVYTDICNRGRLPVVVGGTGLYIEAVLRDYNIPAVPENVQLRKDLMEKDKAFLIDELKKNDPDLLEKTDCSSKKRIVRALEITVYKKEFPDCNTVQKKMDLNPLVLCVRWQRETLRKRIDERLALRLKQGMVEEVKKLLNAGISPERFAMFGMEYKHAAQYLEGTVSYKTMVANLQTSIHQLAKRQETWFRGMERRGIQMHWIDNADVSNAAEIADQYYQVKG